MPFSARPFIPWFVAPLLAAGGDGDRVVLKDGRERVGRFVASQAHRVWFEDAVAGGLAIPRTDVRTIVRADEEPGLFAPLVLESASAPPPADYIRYSAPTAAGPGHLSTGVARFFHAPTRTTLFLVGAVHIAETAYYERVQDVLDSCDIVLFEGVGPRPGQPAPSGDELERLDALTQVQMKLKDALGFVFQHDGLDYHHPFWKNADVDFSSLSERMAQEGVELPTDGPIMRAFLNLVVGTLDLQAAGSDPGVRRMLRRQAGAAMTMADSLFAGSQKKLGEVLVDWRNDAALAVLDRELAAGPKGRWLALFYGAAHLPDLAKKAAARGFEFERSGWLDAWTIE